VAVGLSMPAPLHGPASDHMWESARQRPTDWGSAAAAPGPQASLARSRRQWLPQVGLPGQVCPDSAPHSSWVLAIADSLVPARRRVWPSQAVCESSAQWGLTAWHWQACGHGIQVM